MQNFRNERPMGISAENPSKQIQYFIKDVGLPFNLAPEILGLKPSQFLQWMSGGPVPVEITQLLSLSQYLNIDEDSIMNGTYDKDLVRRRLFQSADTLPEKYLHNQFSYVRSSAHILKYLTLSRGQHFSDRILRKLNVSPLLYSNHNNKISIGYFVDLLDALTESGLSQTELDNLSGMLFLGVEGTKVGDEFRKANNYYECYRVLSEQITQFDNNFEYTFELERSRCLIRAQFLFDKHNHEQWSLKKILRLERYRHLLSGWYPFLSNLAPVLPQHSLQAYSNRIEASYLIQFPHY